MLKKWVIKKMIRELEKEMERLSYEIENHCWINLEDHAKKEGAIKEVIQILKSKL